MHQGLWVDTASIAYVAALVVLQLIRPPLPCPSSTSSNVDHQLGDAVAMWELAHLPEQVSERLVVDPLLGTSSTVVVGSLAPHDEFSRSLNIFK